MLLPWRLRREISSDRVNWVANGRLSRTEDGSGTAKLGESTHGSMVLLGQGVLDGCNEETSAAGGHGGLDRGAQGVLGVVVVFLVGSHV